MLRRGAWLEIPLGSRRFRLDLWLLAIMAFAAIVRLNGLDWGWSDFDPTKAGAVGERFYTFHPDEASNVRVACNFEESDSWRPTGDLYGQKVAYSLYGASTVYLQVLAVKLGALFTGIDPYVESDHASQRMTYLSVRWMTALLGLVSILLLYYAAARLYNHKVARLAALLLAAATFHAQSGRFGTVDIPMVFFTLWSFAHAVHLLKEDSWKHRLLAALAAGLAVSTKINAVLVVLPLIAAELLREDWPKASIAELLKESLSRLFSKGLIAAGLVTIGVFFVINPYAFLDWRDYLFADHAFGLFHILKNVRGEFYYPFQIQFQDITPFLFLLGNVLFWAAGPALELAGLAGIPWLLLKRRKADLVLLAWVLPAFLMTAAARVMFMRYSLPFLPLLALLAAVLLVDLMSSMDWRRRLGQGLGLIVVLVSAGWTLALASVHNSEDSRITAGRWLYHNLPEGARLLHERSANTIKLTIDMPRYQNVCLEIPTIYRADANSEAEKLDFLASKLEQVDWAAILESNRKLGYERSSRYPAERAFYRALYAGELGFSRDTSFQVKPSLFGLEIDDRAAEFSLRYYDHEQVDIFRRTDPEALAAGIDRLKEELERDSGTVDYQLARAQRLIEQGNPNGARSLLVEVIDGDRGQAPAIVMIAEMLADVALSLKAAGDAGQAAQLGGQADELFNRALALPSSNVNREGYLATWALARGRLLGAEAGLSMLQQARQAGLSGLVIDKAEAELLGGQRP